MSCAVLPAPRARVHVHPAAPALAQPHVQKEGRVKPAADKDDVLLLGMVFAHRAQEPKRGQEFRDRVRCEAVRDEGYNVFTLDNKHEDENIDEHCTANFADKRRMLKAMRSKWVSMPAFKHVILDYFFSPIGWARHRWSAPFFSDTLPALAQENILAPDGKVWLPNLSCITDNLVDAIDALSPHFKIKLVSMMECHTNPLYRATDKVDAPLLSCPDALTNETQLRPLLENSAYPFYVLERVGENEKGGFAILLDNPITPQNRVTKRPRGDSQSTPKSQRARA